MKYDIYYIDAFTDKLFSGNPAAVIFSDISDSALMQNIAAENNLSETAFIREDDGNYHIRWFSPHCEIDLCGHATLASAYVFFNYISPNEKIFNVHSLKNGILTVSQNDDLLLLDFPKDQIKPFDESKLIHCISGSIFDVIIDLRKNSPTYLKWESFSLSSKNKKLLFIPKGCAHGFLTTADNTGVVYYVDNFYSPRHEKVIKYNDERFNIQWPISIRKVSKKDA